MGNTKNAFGKPVYDDNYSFPQDSQDAVDFADEFANVRVGTSAARQSLVAGKRRPGMLWVETDLGGIYRCDESLNWIVAVVPDTGWVNLGPYNSGWSTEGADTPQYRVLNGSVHFRGRIDATSIAGTTPFNMVLPAAARPSRDTPIFLGVTSGSTPTHFPIVIGANGAITVFKGSSAVNDLALGGIPAIPVG